MEREAETESHDLHRIHRAYGHLPIWLFLMQRRAQQSLAHSGILAFRRLLQARHFFGKSRTCSSGNFGGMRIHQSWLLLGASPWFPSLQGCGGDTSTELTAGSLWAP